MQGGILDSLQWSHLILQPTRLVRLVNMHAWKEGIGASRKKVVCFRFDLEIKIWIGVAGVFREVKLIYLLIALFTDLESYDD